MFKHTINICQESDVSDNHFVVRGTYRCGPRVLTKPGLFQITQPFCSSCCSQFENGTDTFIRLSDSNVVCEFCANINIHGEFDITKYDFAASYQTECELILTSKYACSNVIVSSIKEKLPHAIIYSTPQSVNVTGITHCNIDEIIDAALDYSESIHQNSYKRGVCCEMDIMRDQCECYKNRHVAVYESK